MTAGAEGLGVAASLQLPSTAESPSRARRFIQRFCSEADFPTEVCETAALLVSELVTNAIVHGRSSARIEIYPPEGTLRVSVRDDNPTLPPVGDEPDLEGVNGRGLVIVSRLADAWGVEPAQDGKAVWFELHLH